MVTQTPTSGMVIDRDSGDLCGTVNEKVGITNAKYELWDLDLEESCAALFLYYYICTRLCKWLEVGWTLFSG